MRNYVKQIREMWEKAQQTEQGNNTLQKLKNSRLMIRNNGDNRQNRAS